MSDRARVVLREARRSTRSVSDLRRSFNTVLTFLKVDCEKRLISIALDSTPSGQNSSVPRAGMPLPLRPAALIGCTISNASGLLSSSGELLDDGASGSGFPPGACALSSPVQIEQLEVLRTATVLVAAVCRRAREWATTGSRDGYSEEGEAGSSSVPPVRKSNLRAYRSEPEPSGLQVERRMVEEVIRALLHLVELVESSAPARDGSAFSGRSSTGHPPFPPSQSSASQLRIQEEQVRPDGTNTRDLCLTPLPSASSGSVGTTRNTDEEDHVVPAAAEGPLWDSRQPISYSRSSAMMAVAYGLGEARDYYHLLHEQAKKRVAAALSGSWVVEDVVSALLDVSMFQEEEHECYIRRAASASAASESVGDVTLGEKIAVGDESGTAGVELACCRCPLRDPLSHTLIILPARGRSCSHLEFFDARNFVLAAHNSTAGVKSRGSSLLAAPHPGMNCPFCKNYIRLDELRVDQRVTRAISAYQRASKESTRHYDGGAERMKRAYDGSEARMDDPPHLELSPSCGVAVMPCCLSADDVVEWDLKCQPITCRIVAASRDPSGREQRCSDSASAASNGEAPNAGAGSPGDANLNADAPATGTASTGLGVDSGAKRRRVDIGGHVLFVED